MNRKHVLTGADLKARGSFVVDHLASKSVAIKAGSGVDGPGWRLEVTAEGPPARRSVANLLVHKLDGSVQRLPLGLDGVAVSVPFDVRKVTITLANASTRYD